MGYELIGLGYTHRNGERLALNGWAFRRLVEYISIVAPEFARAGGDWEPGTELDSFVTEHLAKVLRRECEDGSTDAYAHKRNVSSFAFAVEWVDWLSEFLQHCGGCRIR